MALDINLREKSSFLLNLLHFLDCLLVAVILWLFVIVYKVPWSEAYSYLAIVSFILSFVIFSLVKLYQPRRGIKLLKELFVIFKAWVIFACILLSLFFFFRVSNQYSRAVITSWLAIGPIAIFFVHLMVRRTLNFVRRRGKNLRYAVIIGAGDLGLNFASHIEEIPWAGIKVIGFFDDNNNCQNLLNQYPVLGTISQLSDYLNKHNIDYVYIALPLRAEDKIISILNDCRTFGAQIFMLPDLYIFDIFNGKLQTLGDIPIINFNPDYCHKKYFDVVFSVIIILVLLPILIIIALLIKLEDGGPVFYRAKRITLAGKEFKCWKFRTMVVDADKKLDQILKSYPEAQKEWESIFKLKNDPRVTRVGRIIRKFSLDELPQFYNVIMGDMSIVGPRPIVQKEINKYYKGKAGLYCSVKPGITGPWQVGPRNDMPDYIERVRLDMWYVQNISLLLDLKIIYRTIFTVLNGKGAY
jgi:putative colanic acid biosysnthesis UDP-glucose lipid carrier transferase